MCGAQSEAITGRPDDKIVQSEHGRRMKVGGDVIEEEGEIRCEEEKQLDEKYSTKMFFFFLCQCLPQMSSHCTKLKKQQTRICIINILAGR